jgi:hypothetical protein
MSPRVGFSRELGGPADKRTRADGGTAEYTQWTRSRSNSCTRPYPVRHRRVRHHRAVVVARDCVYRLVHQFCPTINATAPSSPRSPSNWKGPGTLRRTSGQALEGVARRRVRTGYGRPCWVALVLAALARRGDDGWITFRAMPAGAATRAAAPCPWSNRLALCICLSWSLRAVALPHAREPNSTTRAPGCTSRMRRTIAPNCGLRPTADAGATVR